MRVRGATRPGIFLTAALRKICTVLKALAMPSGGSGSHILFYWYGDPDDLPPLVNASRVLAGAGYRVRILAFASAGRWNVSYPPEVELLRLTTPGRSTKAQYLEYVLRGVWAARGGARVVVGHDRHAFLPARLAAALLRRPVIYHCHDYVPRSPHQPLQTRVVSWFEHRFARTADMVIVPDADRAQIVAAGLRLSGEPVVVANAPLARPGPDDGSLRRALQARGHRFNRIVFRQGHIGFGHALEATVRSLPFWSDSTWGFVVMGPGPQEYRDHLVSVARELGVEDRLVILPKVGYDEISRFTVGADLGHALYDPVHVNNEYIATASNKIMEYMAAGVPSLLSDTPAMRGLAEKYGCAVTADETSPRSIAEAVNNAFADPERLSGMSRAAAGAFDRVFAYPLQYAPVLGWIDSLD